MGRLKAAEPASLVDSTSDSHGGVAVEGLLLDQSGVCLADRGEVEAAGSGNSWKQQCRDLHRTLFWQQAYEKTILDLW